MDVIWLVFLFLLGACVGSFLNVVIYRVPRGESIVFPGSRCPSCGRAIRWYDNIPLASWLILKARCRDCHAPISGRYFLIELATAVIFAGLYAGYFMFELRQGMGPFTEDWPVYAAHAALLAGLLACLMVDLDLWIIPLEVTWVCAAVGVALAAIFPAAYAAGPQGHTSLATVSPGLIAASLGAMAGLAAACWMLRRGWLRRSFIDAHDVTLEVPAEPTSKKGDGRKSKPKPKAIAFSREHGVDPRREILHEVLFLAPPAALAVAAWIAVTYLPPLSAGWARLFDEQASPRVAGHLTLGGSAVFGYLVGGLWIWGVRILGTLGFGKEAMGLGDAHILAAVGAVGGWVLATMVFFIAPFMGLLWALYLLISRRQKELPYGPWLAAATLVAILFYDGLMDLAMGYARLTLAVP